jgi:hypothetical protein
MRKTHLCLLVVAVALFNSSLSGRQIDCATFLRGAEKPVGKGYEPPTMSKDDLERATSTRLCMMTFAQLELLRPLLKQDRGLDARRRRIDDLYAKRRGASAAQREDLSAQLDEEIHQLFSEIKKLSGDRLGEIADRLRSGQGELRSEGYPQRHAPGQR